MSIHSTERGSFCPISWALIGSIASDLDLSFVFLKLH